MIRVLLALAVLGWQSLPAYHPHTQVSGMIHNVGFGFGDLLEKWERAFSRVEPGVRFEDRLPTSDAAIPALITGVSDLGPDGGEPSLTESLAFYETYGYAPTAITVASGSYDVDGRSNGIVVYVNARNPISRLTLAQLDGIFGEERTGGLDGFKWMISNARGSDGDIRKWGQLGLTGAWAPAQIQTYGHAPSGTTRFFQAQVLHDSDKWNPNYREFVETGSKMIGPDDPQQLGGLTHMLYELANDRYGIAWTIEPIARGVPGIKPIALARSAGGPYVRASKQSFEDRSYPLVRSIYIYLNRRPGTALTPAIKEFLRFILSRDGQAIVAHDGNYLPLPLTVVHQQLTKLE